MVQIYSAFAYFSFSVSIYSFQRLQLIHIVLHESFRIDIIAFKHEIIIIAFRRNEVPVHAFLNLLFILQKDVRQDVFLGDATSKIFWSFLSS